MNTLSRLPVRIGLLGLFLALSACAASQPPHLATPAEVGGNSGAQDNGSAGAGTPDGPSGGVAQ